MLYDEYLESYNAFKAIKLSTIMMINTVYDDDDKNDDDEMMMMMIDMRNSTMIIVFIAARKRKSEELTYEETSPISSGVHGPNRTTAVAPEDEDR